MPKGGSDMRIIIEIDEGKAPAPVREVSVTPSEGAPLVMAPLAALAIPAINAGAAAPIVIEGAPELPLAPGMTVAGTGTQESAGAAPEV
jgi:hypothetical protein